MHILITGGTGFIGSNLIKQLKAHSKITVVSRQSCLCFDRFGHDISCIDDLNKLPSLNQFDAVINLAGEPIADKYWTNRQKWRIKQSRWNITQQLVDLFEKSKIKPKVFISGSAIGYYGRQAADIDIDETFSQPHHEFTYEVCEKWERVAKQVEQHTRLCILRTGIVLGREGALKKMSLPFKLYAGGALGSGQQVMSWIHIDDMVEAIIYLLNNESSRGVYNLTAPNPVNNLAFSQALASALNRPCWLTMPAVMLRLILGELSDLMLTGQKVKPTRLLEEGFEFRFTDIDTALQHLSKPHRH
ncbi:TIGR01777 family protein [Saccharobesus litoralis]|uniref:TIGR01777 family protein n=1 Tax=Saccharobesus litoralis TaxID=2172099 RepID=A0A2S0VVB3_9ALTE|nr:TIGR01777 family oxidoreductase [Saccharobesus litoralis]AWB68112.1 TIGR01777 family protein [Saccharobesus litoralis]